MKDIPKDLEKSTNDLASILYENGVDVFNLSVPYRIVSDRKYIEQQELINQIILEVENDRKQLKKAMSKKNKNRLYIEDIDLDDIYDFFITLLKNKQKE